MSKDLMIRSSSAEFLIFERQTHDKGIQVRFEDGDLWLTQNAIGELFDTTRNNITMHINDIYDSYELDKNSTSKQFLLVQNEGNRKVKRNVQYYNLDMVISIGYKVNSERAIQFRRWATYILKEFSRKGYIIDKKRMANGAFFDEDYYDSLLSEIREIRLSERRFYQKVTDIYATSVDYDKKSPTTIKFFKKVQNKMHYAVSHQTAAEIIYNRADSKKEYMGLTSWKNSPNGKILETDVVIAKKYLSKEELESLELIVSAFLDLAENRAKRHIPMTMEDWATRIDKFLLADDLDILKNADKISHEIARDKALTEFEKYRIKQDKLYKSDFDDTLAIHRDREYLQHRNENEENLQNNFLNAYLNPEKFYDIIEKLADYEHDRWSRWQKHVFSKCIINQDGSLTIPKEFVDRWTRQINTNYTDLSEQEKDSDRKEAIRIIECIKDKVDYNE